MAEHPVPIEDLPNIDPASLRPIDMAALSGPGAPAHPPRILMLYGSLRARSYSRFASEEAARLLRWFGAETRAFNPSGLPLPDAESPTTRRSGSCATSLPGRKAWAGARRSGMAR